MDIRPFIGRLEGEELDKQLAEADGFVDFGFSPAMIEKAPKLQIAASGGVGFNGQDVVRESMGDKSLIDVANDAGIWMTNGAGSLTESTADAALLLLLSAARNFPEAHQLVADGRWEGLGIGGVQYIADKSIEPAGKTLGIIGMGRIGQALARKCVGAFDMDVIYFDARGDATAYTDIPPRWKAVSFETVLRESDFISVHANLSPYNGGELERNEHLIGATELAMMKKTCILVSVARGPHISEDALIDALNNPDQGPVRAGLDVTETEPVIKQGMIDLMKEGIVSAMPHIGSGTNEGRDAMLMFAFDNAYQVLVQGIPPQSPINGFMTPQGHVVRHQNTVFFFEQETTKIENKIFGRTNFCPTRESRPTRLSTSRPWLRLWPPSRPAGTAAAASS